MQRTPVNPWPWSQKLGFNQAEVIEGAERQLFCSGQTSVDGDGNPVHPGDMAAQMNQALDNLEAVLKAAGMDLSNLVRLTVFTTNVEETMKNYGVLGARLGQANVMPATSLLGVSALAMPPLMFEIEATAMG
jgi:enamine deaminase RidA (YjgF/YER057c/UK114 family)